MQKLIYAKVYPNKDALLKKAAEPISTAEISNNTPNDFIERLFNESEYIPIPERIEESQKFIELAIYYSNITETAVEITQGNDSIFVCFYFKFLTEFGDTKDMLTELIQKSNSVDIYKPKDNNEGTLMLQLGFRTHEHYVSGEKTDSIY